MLTHSRQDFYGMGNLYDHEEENTHDSEASDIVYDIRNEEHPPMFVIRKGRQRRSRRRSTLHSLPLYLSFTNLSEDTEIARFISPSMIQHRPTLQPISANPDDIDIPLSLPSTPESHAPISNSISLPSSPNYEFKDWILIPLDICTTFTTTTSSSNPEPWILIDDS
jgi:hypothetical protein